MEKSRVMIMVRCALFTSLIAIGAFIQIPVPFMDYFTLQFLFVLLSGMILGPKKGALSVSVYVLIGLIGVPIFAAGGGIQYIFRPSFGYLLGFIAASFVTGYIAEKNNAQTFSKYLLAAFGGFITTYGIGILYKFLILNFYMGTPTSLYFIIVSCFPLDIPGDILLCLSASFIMPKLKSIVSRKSVSNF
ncbi:biotin transporter BioY [Clostridium butyricum]|uniref:biotin transporter BioY n=1 Tax=Clostridium butyricum TaxID=1492 RepID=UPI0009045AAE|nr:biotin transporter BioY [Clostridium butyricum]APF21311.1 bioY family protein [Clostridium butyricum]